jgi:transcriptional regulator with XRE-family HTH domain
MRAPTKPLNQDRAAITKQREDARLTKYRLAKILGCSRSLITEIEGGTRNAAPDLLTRMAAVFGCPVANLQASPATTSADVDVRHMRDAERTEPEQMPRVR